MPPTAVHVAVGGLLAAALLGPHLDRRSVAVVLAAAALPDLDALLSLLVEGGHNAALHTLVWPFLVGVGLYWATSGGHLAARFGDRGVRVIWAAFASFLVAGIGLDLLNIEGVNALWPLVDQFYTLVGVLELNNKEGLVQTFVQVNTTGGPFLEVGTRGSTADYFVPSPLNPTRGPDAGANRIFRVVETGWQFVLVVASAVVLATRLRGGGR
ncbi:metal-dependent hydrolase [Natronomonas sp. EA1]|uniref:metal-dependent hydrolase n=1 Tax=Natronomonas sp. EA1 TaxID=3421655 RepID=UPI003EBC0097